MFGKHKGQLRKGHDHGSHQALGLFGLVQRWPVVRLASGVLGYAAVESTNLAAEGALQGVGGLHLLLWFGLHSCTLAPCPILACCGLPPLWVLGGRGDFMYQLHWAAFPVKESGILRVNECYIQHE